MFQHYLHHVNLKIILIIPRSRHLALQQTEYFSQNFWIGHSINPDLIASEPHFLRSITVMRRLDFCLLRARPLGVHRDSGGGGRGTRIFLDHRNPAPPPHLHYYIRDCPWPILCKRKRRLAVWDVLATSGWFEILVFYHLADLRGMTYSFLASVFSSG